jgi:predicted nucleotidyltransferase
MDRVSTREQRARTLVQLLDEKLDWIRAHAMDALRYDHPETVDGVRSRAIAWRLGSHEFLLTYQELADVPGSAVFRARTQPFVPGEMRDAWKDLGSLGELDNALRAAKKQKGPSGPDLKAAKNARKHEAPMPEGLILVGLTGSHAYGLAHEGYTDPETGTVYPPSDVDTRGVFVVPTKQVLALEKPRILVEHKDTDAAYDEVERFMQLCLKGNPERLEMLAAPKTLVTPEGQLLVDHQRMFLSKGLIKTYGGYAKQQLYRIESKQQRTSKPVLHLIRLMITGIRILEEGRVNPDMSAYRDRLLAIRFGRMSIEEAFAWHHALEVQFARAAEQTKLPEFPDTDQANRILLDIRRNHLNWDE